MNDMDRRQAEVLAEAVRQMKAEGWAMLLYHGKNRTLVVFSKGRDVFYLGEANDG